MKRLILLAVLLIIGACVFVYNWSVRPFDDTKLWNLVQMWRISKNLPIYIKDQKLCELARTRASEILTDYSHAGFYSRHFSYDAAENLAPFTHSEEETLKDWLLSPEHLTNLEHKYKYSCIDCNSKRYCVQEFAQF